jgi:hypothetical protein
LTLNVALRLESVTDADPVADAVEMRSRTLVAPWKIFSVTVQPTTPDTENTVELVHALPLPSASTAKPTEFGASRLGLRLNDAAMLFAR